MNLLLETVSVLVSNNKTIADIEWIGSSDGAFAITWDEFVLIANQEYDSGYGAQEVATDLVVVGVTWWIERHEYDGSEWWEFKELPIKKNEPKHLETLFALRKPSVR